MTRRELHLEARNVAIWCARRGGALVPVIALAHGLSVNRTRAILRAMAQPDVQIATVERILSSLENKALASIGRAIGNPRRAASL